MIDFEKAYQELESNFSNQFISLYDLILMIRYKHPSLSDNKIASVLLDKFKRHSSIYSDKYQYLGIFDNLLTSEEVEIINAGDIYCCNKPKKLHEPYELRNKEDLFYSLEQIENWGIIEPKYFCEDKKSQSREQLENSENYIKELYLEKSVIAFILRINRFNDNLPQKETSLNIFTRLADTEKALEEANQKIKKLEKREEDYKKTILSEKNANIDVILSKTNEYNKKERASHLQAISILATKLAETKPNTFKSEMSGSIKCSPIAAILEKESEELFTNPIKHSTFRRRIAEALKAFPITCQNSEK